MAQSLENLGCIPHLMLMRGDLRVVIGKGSDHGTPSWHERVLGAQGPQAVPVDKWLVRLEKGDGNSQVFCFFKSHDGPLD